MTGALGSATSTGADKLADKLNQRRAEDHQSTFTTAQVVAGSTDRQVAVDMDGDTQLWPFVAGYTPRTGDAVVLGGGPGWWVCLGSISGVGPARASTQQVYDLTVDHDVAVGHDLVAQNGLRANNGLSSGGETAVGTVLSVGTRARSPNWSSSLSDGAIRWDSTGALEVVNYGGTERRGVYASRFVDNLGDVRTAGGSVPEVKTDVQEIDPHAALAALAKLDYATWRYIGDFVTDGSAHGELRRFAGPMMTSTFVEDPLLKTVIRYGIDDEPDTFDIQSLLGLVAAALPAIRVNLDEQVAALAPLKRTADQLPQIVAHSDQVHTELQQGLDTIRTAVAAVQQAAGSLGTSLTPIAQLAAQAQAQAAIASAAASAAGQRCAALEARVSTLEGRKVQTWRAAGNLPTLALNGTTSVTCPWTSAVPSPLPAVDQCQVFVAGAATPTVTAVSASAVTVSLKAIDALLPVKGAVQVLAATW